MKIVQVNKFYYPKGGADIYALQLSHLLERAGHQVVPFAMRQTDNVPTPFARYFVSGVDLRAREGWARDAQKAMRIIFSLEARRKFRQLLEDEQPDIIHVHNAYHQLSPSIFGVARRMGIPVVMTLHDYKLGNPNYRAFHRGELCDHSANGRYWEAVRYRCMDTMAGSVTVALEAYVHRFLKTYEKGVSRFISPSEFLIDYMVARLGWERERFVHIPLFVAPPEDKGAAGEGRHILYAGRLSEEKGLMTLLQAAKMNPHIPVLIAGKGPQEAALRSRAGELGLRNVTFAGYLSGSALARSLNTARAVAVPSVGYENSPLSVLEAQQAGKVVIASRIGGIPELITHGEDGFLVPPGDALSLAKAIERVWDMEISERGAMEGAARERVMRHNGALDHLRRITALYRSVIVPFTYEKPRKLSIAMIGQKGYPARYGGVERHVQELADRLALRGHAVTVYARAWYSTGADAVPADHRVPRRVVLGSVRTKHADTITHTLRSLVHAAGEGYAIIHLHGVGPALLVPLARLLTRARVVVTIHSLNREHPQWGAFARVALLIAEWVAAHSANQLITVSRHLRLYMRRRYGVGSSTIPNGVTVPDRLPSVRVLSRWGLEARRYVAVVGRLVETKAVHTVIGAWRLLPAAVRADKKLILVGDESFSRAYVSALKKRAGRDEGIVFTGWQEGEALSSLIAHAAIMVQASVSEGMPMALLEAMSYGVPLLVSDIPAHRELVVFRETFFPVYDEPALARLLQRAFADPGWYQKRGAEGKRLVEQQYRWDAVVSKTLGVYYRALMRQK